MNDNTKTISFFSNATQEDEEEVSLLTGFPVTRPHRRWFYQDRLVAVQIGIATILQVAKQAGNE